MKKSVVLALLVFLAAAQFLPAAEVPVDLVVLMDNSESVYQYYDDIVDYIITYVIKDYIRFGDTFHLISFSNNPQIEIAQKINAESDLKTILGRLYLVYPIGKATDFISSLGFLHQYLAVLPENSRKIAVIITDGIHNPEKSSQYYGYDAERVSRELETTARKMRDSGWTIMLIKVPFTRETAAKNPSENSLSASTPENVPVLKSDDVFSSLSKNLGVNAVTFNPEDKESVAVSTMSLPKLTFPPHLGKKDYLFSAPFQTENVSDKEIFLELASVTSNGTNILADKSFLRLGPKSKGTLSVPLRIPETVKPGETTLSINLSFSNGVRVVPTNGVLAFTLAPSPFSAILRTGTPVILFIIILAVSLVGIVVVIIFIKRLRSRPDLVVAGTVTESYEREKTAAIDSARKPASIGEAESEKESVFKIELKSDAKAEIPSWLKIETVKTKKEVLQEKRSEEIIAIKEEAQAKSLESSLIVKKQGSIRVLFTVDEQNPDIGMRNVRQIKAGAKLTVGSGRADFLVFVIPVPVKIAEVFYDGENLTFIPVRKDYFPELSGMTESCLGKTIKAVSKNGFCMNFKFDEYVSPADKVNNFLRCLDMPVLPAV